MDYGMKAASDKISKAKDFAFAKKEPMEKKEEVSKPSKLHEALGMKPGEKIPMSKLMEHKDSKDAQVRKMVQFALNMRKKA